MLYHDIYCMYCNFKSFGETAQRNGSPSLRKEGSLVYVRSLFIFQTHMWCSAGKQMLARAFHHHIAMFNNKVLLISLIVN